MRQYIRILIGHTGLRNRLVSETSTQLQGIFKALGIGTQLRYDWFLTTIAEGEERSTVAKEYFDLAFMVLVSLCPRLRNLNLDSYSDNEGYSLQNYITAGIPVFDHAPAATEHLLYHRTELRNISLLSWVTGDRRETLHSVLRMPSVERVSARESWTFPKPGRSIGEIVDDRYYKYIFRIFNPKSS